MAHTIRDKERLLHRVRRAKGQMEAIERALEEERDCFEVLQLITACRGAIGGLMSEVIEGHVREHVLSPRHRQNPDQVLAVEQLVEVLRTYLK
jgi:DNA-binding FrmR family transcriptional regulator